MLPTCPTIGDIQGYVGTRWIDTGELHQVIRVEADRSLLLTTTNSEEFKVSLISEGILQAVGSDAFRMLARRAPLVYAGFVSDFDDIRSGAAARIQCNLGYWDLTIDRVIGTGVTFREPGMNGEPVTLTWVAFLRGCSHFSPRTLTFHIPEEDALILTDMVAYGIGSMVRYEKPSPYQPIRDALCKLVRYELDDETQDLVRALDDSFGDIPLVRPSSIWDRLAGEET